MRKLSASDPIDSILLAASGKERLDDSDREEAHARALVELLLSEHSGDCLSPCARSCPAGLDPMLVCEALAYGDTEAAFAITIDQVPLPFLIAAKCKGYCELVCRRRLIDSPLSIRAGHAEIAKNIDIETRKRILFPKRDTADYPSRALVSGPPLECLAASATLMRKACEVTLVIDNCLEELKADLEMYREAGLIIFAQGATQNYEASQKLEIPPSKFAQTMPARAMAEGKALAEAFLLNRAFDASGAQKEKPISIVTDISATEMLGLAKDIEKLSGAINTTNANPSVQDARRCLSCGCEAKGSCLLEASARELGIRRVSGQGGERRLRVTRKIHECGNGSLLVFEAGKCVKCARCVSISREAGAPLCFRERGFDIELYGLSELEKAGSLALIAEKIADNCPTGALRYKEARP